MCQIVSLSKYLDNLVDFSGDSLFINNSFFVHLGDGTLRASFLGCFNLFQFLSHLLFLSFSCLGRFKAEITVFKFLNCVSQIVSDTSLKDIRQITLKILDSSLGWLTVFWVCIGSQEGRNLFPELRLDVDVADVVKDFLVVWDLIKLHLIAQFID